MIWLIGVAVLAFMLAPLIWIIPSPRQQRQTRIRERARLLGLQVRVTALPQSRRQRVRKESPETVVAYSLMLSKRRQPREKWGYWLSGPGQEEGESELPLPPVALHPLLAQLASSLPSDALLLECTGMTLVLYWRELGAEPSTIDALAAVLEQLAAGLA